MQHLHFTNQQFRKLKRDSNCSNKHVELYSYTVIVQWTLQTVVRICCYLIVTSNNSKNENLSLPGCDTVQLSEQFSTILTGHGDFIFMVKQFP